MSPEMRVILVKGRTGSIDFILTWLFSGDQRCQSVAGYAVSISVAQTADCFVHGSELLSLLYKTAVKYFRSLITLPFFAKLYL